MINTHIEASKIGRQIADQVLDYQRRLGDASSGKQFRSFTFILLSLFFYTESSPDPDPTVGIQAQSVSAISENQLNASLDGDHSSAGNSSSVPSRINGTYANFTTYNHARSSTVVSPENGNIAFCFILFVFIMACNLSALQLDQASQEVNKRLLETMEIMKIEMKQRWL